MQANDSLEYRDKIIDAFKNGTFLSEHFLKNQMMLLILVLEVINNYIEEIKSMEEKINLSLFEEFFESSSLANYAKCLLILKIEIKIKER